MAKLTDLIAARSRLIRKFNKLSDDEFNELEETVFVVASDAADEFARQQRRTVGEWAIQLLDWIPRQRAMLIAGNGAKRDSQARLDALWGKVRPDYQRRFSEILARLKAHARGEPMASREKSPERVKRLAEFMVLAWGPR